MNYSDLIEFGIEYNAHLNTGTSTVDDADEEEDIFKVMEPLNSYRSSRRSITR